MSSILKQGYIVSVKKAFLRIVVLNDCNNLLVNNKVNLHSKASTTQEAVVLAHKLKFVISILIKGEYFAYYLGLP